MSRKLVSFRRKIDGGAKLNQIIPSRVVKDTNGKICSKPMSAEKSARIAKNLGIKE